jgi:hypothetical protein
MDYPDLLSHEDIVCRGTPKENIMHLVLTENYGPFVYFLINESEIIYVGQTFSLKGRIYQHTTEKTFTHVCFLEVKGSDLNNIEAAYIVKLNPSINRTIPSNDLYASTGAIRTRSMETLKAAVDRAVEIIGPSFQHGDHRPAKYFKIADVDLATAKIAAAIEESLSDLDAWVTGEPLEAAGE